MKKSIRNWSAQQARKGGEGAVWANRIMWLLFIAGAAYVAWTVLQ